MVNSISKILNISPFKTRKITPKVDNNIPIVCTFVILLFNMKNESTNISMGTIELIKSAFVAVVVCNAMYNNVLKSVIPKRDKKERSIKFFLKIETTFLISIIKKAGIRRITTNIHLKKANSKGSTVVLINRPIIKLPDQKSTQSANNR